MLKTFDEVFDDYTKYGTKIKTEQYHTVGTNIIIDQGQADIAGYTDQIDGLFKDVPVIVFGDHTRIIKYINRPFFLGADGTKILKSKIPDANYKYLYYALKNAKIPNTGYNRHFKWLKQISISYPEHQKQSMIVEILDKLEDSIDNYNTILGLLDKLVKARFVEMFGDKKYDSVPLLDTIKTGAGLSYGIVVPGDDVEDGIPMVRPSDFKDGTLDLSNVYKVAKDIERKYSKTRLIGDEILVQVIGQPGQVMLATEECNGMNVTRNLAVVRPNHEIINRIYLKHFIEKEDSQQILLKNTKQSTLKQLPLNLLKQLPVQLPPIELQKEFESFVQQIDKSREEVKKSLEKTQQLYDSLMQEYFG